MVWSLYSQEGFMPPLEFSNAKTQEDVVKEVLEEIAKGQKVIFIKGVCGTGKSAIALNLAKELGKTSIIVPGKSLQNQYKKDYEGNKYVLKKNNEKLKINVLTGRNNHQCKFLEDSKEAVPVFKKETNSKLFDIFDKKREEISGMIGKDLSANNPNIPCKIKIKEANWFKIKEYLKKNKEVNDKNVLTVKDVKRLSIAPVCPYWSPIFEDKYEFKQPSLNNAIKKKYKGMNNKEFIFYYRRLGCPFYEQFNHYVDSDVLVFNSLKYKLEFALNRKPETEVEVIDECDEFLDSFSNQRKINLDRLQKSIIFAGEVSSEAMESLAEIGEIVRRIKEDFKIDQKEGNIIPLNETEIADLLKFVLKQDHLLEEFDEENYFFDVWETAKIFESFLDESYVIFEKKEDSLKANLVTTNLEKRFNELKEKNKVLVLMSGTLHSDQVLRDVFGLKDFKVIDAETQKRGEIKILKTGLERDCKYSNFGNGSHSREDYLRALDKCVEKAPRPTLIHITAFYDLPSEKELKDFGLRNLISREDLKEIQFEDKEGKEIRKFKRGEMDVLFSTKASRGIDFPGDECRGVIFTKYPNPDVKEPFWRILNLTKPIHYWSFYKDKARRELLQKVYRGLRSKEDYVSVLSPDSRVLEFFEKLDG